MPVARRRFNRRSGARATALLALLAAACEPPASPEADGAPPGEVPGDQDDRAPALEPAAARGAVVARGDVVRFAVIGDYGVPAPSADRVAALVAAWAPDFIVTTGDNNYPSGARETIDDNVGRLYHPFIGSYRGAYGTGSPENRFWPSPGNHDWRTDALGPYLEYFTLPGNERYYDVDHGVVRLWALDSDPREPDGTTPDSVQGRWLRDGLWGSTACFDLVHFHHPPHASGLRGAEPHMRWPFEAWGAEAVLSGHEHHYERLQIGGLPYFVVGLAGHPRLYAFGEPEPESRVRFADAHGALFVTATPAALRFELHTVDGRIVDPHTVTAPDADGDGLADACDPD